MKLNSMRTVLAALCLCATAGGMAPAAPGTQPPATAATMPSNMVPEAVRVARVLRDHGNYERAEALLRHMEALPFTPPEKQRLTAELAALERIREQWARLTAIQTLIDLRQRESAATALSTLAPEVKDARVAQRLAEVAADLDSRNRNPLFILGDWLVTLLPFLILFGLLLVWRAILARPWSANSNKWRLTEVSDSTSRGAKDLIAHYFSDWSKDRDRSVTSGLLLMEASAIPDYPNLDLAANQFDVGPDLEGIDLTVAGVNITAAFRILPRIKRWLLPHIPITGFAYLDEEKHLCARLTTRLPEHKKNAYITVSAVADGSDEAAVHRVAKEVTFKMLYALTSDVEAGEAADELRKGLTLLKSYLSGVSKAGSTPWKDLDEARGIFEVVRSGQPDSLEAHLYEGIALDLLEQHDDAIAHFDYVRQLTEGATDDLARKRNDQATYNGAVANLRNLYGLKEVDEAIERFESFIGSNPDFVGRPILALAAATLADAWANRTIQWDKLENLDLGLAADATEDDKLLAAISHHGCKIGERIASIEYHLGIVRGQWPEAAKEAASAVKIKWNEATLRQVEWAIHNAWGDFYLYAATSLTKLDVGGTARFKELGDVKKSEQFKDFIARAIEELRYCEMLLPPGVETLSNLGTLYLTRAWPSDFPVARQYFQRAIALNPHYEYAHYRLAQTWEADSWREKVVAALKACPVPPRIGKHREMFARYYVEPKFEYAAEPPPAPADPQPAPASGNQGSAPAH